MRLVTGIPAAAAMKRLPLQNTTGRVPAMQAVMIVGTLVMCPTDLKRNGHLIRIIIGMPARNARKEQMSVPISRKTVCVSIAAGKKMWIRNPPSRNLNPRNLNPRNKSLQVRKLQILSLRKKRMEKIKRNFLSGSRW